MKKKLTCILLCLCLCLSLLPVTALAADDGYGLYVGGVEVTEQNRNNITAAVSGASGTASYDPDTNTLTLRNFVYTGIGQAASDRSTIRFIGNTALNIVLSGTNQLGADISFPNVNIDTDEVNKYLAHGILTDGPLTVSGSGSLKVCSLASCIVSTAGDISFGTDFSGRLTAHCGHENKSGSLVDISCIEAKDGSVSVLGGSMSLTSDAGSGISAYNDTYDSNLNGGEGGYAADRNVTISNASVIVTADDHGIYVYRGNLSVCSGSVTLNTKSEGMFVSTFGNVQISGGTVSIVSDDVEEDGSPSDRTGLVGIHVNGSGTVEISGGTLDVFGGNSGIYVSSGELTVSGGELAVSARENVCIGCANDDETNGYDGSVTISGGKITAESEKGIGIWADDGDLTVSGGEVTVTTGELACLCSEDGDVLITGGTVTATSEQREAICSERGSISFTGGTVTASSERSEAIYAERGSISFTGGLTTAESGSVSAVRAAGDGKITVGESMLIKAGANKQTAEIKDEYTDEAWAQFGVPYPVWVGGTQVTGLNRDDVLGNGTVSYVPADGDSAAVLTLNGAEISGYSVPLSFVPVVFGIFAEESLSLKLIGENKVHPVVPSQPDSENATFLGSVAIGFGAAGAGQSACNLTVSGTGSLEALSDIPSGSSFGIYLDGGFRLDSGTVTVGAENGVEAFGIAAEAGLTVNGGTLTVYGENAPIEEEEEDPAPDSAVLCAAIWSNEISVAGTMQVKAGTASDGSDAVKVTDLVENCDAYRYVQISPIPAPPPPGPSGGGTTTKPEPEEEPLPFEDVAEDRWSYDDIAFCYRHGYLFGVSETRFDPTGTTTRGQFAAILYRMAGRPAVANDSAFSDVAADSYYASAVAWASENGIVSGYGNNRFGPGDPVTREQLAVMLYRFTKYLKLDVSVDENTNFLSFGDFQSISEYAKPAMMWAIENGLIVGDDMNLLPQGQATREQTAAILHRFCGMAGLGD